MEVSIIKEVSFPRFCRNQPNIKLPQFYEFINMGKGIYKEKRITEEEYIERLNTGVYELIRNDTLIVHTKIESK